MLRIAGVNLPDNKHIVIALTAIAGVGRTRARQVLEELRIEPTKKASEISTTEADRIRDFLREKGWILEGDLRRLVAGNIKRKKEIRCYQGIRHQRGLPVHGQRTATNARTRKGRVVRIANKKMESK